MLIGGYGLPFTISLISMSVQSSLNRLFIASFSLLAFSDEPKEPPSFFTRLHPVKCSVLEENGAVFGSNASSPAKFSGCEVSGLGLECSPDTCIIRGHRMRRWRSSIYGGDSNAHQSSQSVSFISTFCLKTFAGSYVTGLRLKFPLAMSAPPRSNFL